MRRENNAFDINAETGSVDPSVHAVLGDSGDNVATVIDFSRYDTDSIRHEGSPRRNKSIQGFAGQDREKTEPFARLILNALSEKIAVLDERGTVIETNKAWNDAADDVPLPFRIVRKGENYLSVCDDIQGESALEAAAFAGAIRSVVAGQEESFFMEYARDANGIRRWFLGNVTRFHGNEAACVVVAHKDITSLKKAEQEIEWLAQHDFLTRLPNRMLFNDRLGQALALADRQKGMAALLFIDLDSFKVINDTLGHAGGDSLLEAVARRLERRVRRSDTIARFGGDEFVIILNGPREMDDVAHAVRSMLDSLLLPFEINGQEVFVAASVGIALYPMDGNNADVLMKSADIAMYHAKERGGNTFLFYQQKMNRKALKRLALETELRHALEKQEFILHYQPWKDLSSGRLSGMEALLRWRHPQKGMVSPLHFIPVAEETSLILPIGEWVLRTACMQAKTLHDAGFPSMKIAVNVSGRQLRHYELADVVEKVLGETGIDPGCLELEFTESSIMEDSKQTIKMLHSIRKMGVKLAIDDFGTGYSSLSYLKRFPIDKIKIDRSFVKGIPSDREDMALTRAMIVMAHSLHLEVVAEGVETEEQLSFLHRQACSIAQGYHISRPLPLVEIQKLVQDRKQKEDNSPMFYI